jgi:hypothetical protein
VVTFEKFGYFVAGLSIIGKSVDQHLVIEYILGDSLPKKDYFIHDINPSTNTYVHEIWTYCTAIRIEYEYQQRNA